MIVLISLAMDAEISNRDQSRHCVNSRCTESVQAPKSTEVT